MTLLEVLVGLVLLGTVASAAMIARGRAMAQWGRSGRRIEAAQVADRLLTQWWLAREMPLDRRGRYDDAVTGRTWDWETQTRRAPAESPWDLTLVRLELAPVGEYEVLATVELAWPFVDDREAP